MNNQELDWKWCYENPQAAAALIKSLSERTAKCPQKCALVKPKKEQE